MMMFPAGNAIFRRETYDNYPAARAIMQCVYEGLQLPIAPRCGLNRATSRRSCAARKRPR